MGARRARPAPVLALMSSCAVLGGDAVSRHLLASLHGAVAGGRAQARYVACEFTRASGEKETARRAFRQ